MSNFETGTFSQVSGGKSGTAPANFIASTEDDLATITTAGYMTDRAREVKHNDIVQVNYLATTLLASTAATFRVNDVAGVLSLVAYP